MKEQNNANHMRIDRGWTVAAIILLGWTVSILIGLGSLIKNYILNMNNAEYAGMFIENFATFLLPLSAIMFVWIGFLKLRAYAKKLQDRIIKQEENFRHFVMTGKQLNPSLSISQIVALRFAGDNEFLALSEKAVQENLTNKEIKVLILLFVVIV